MTNHEDDTYCSDCDCESDVVAEPLVNADLPDVTFKAYHDDEIKTLSLSDYKGKWLVLFFYPADFTFVCPTELEEMANLYDDFKKEGAEVLSISTDTVYVHKAWHDTSSAIRKINFPMVADPTGELSQLFGVYLPNDGLALRGSFIIDPDGHVKAMEVHDNSVGRSGKELIRKLRAAKFVREHKGEVCPANWTPGEKTLKPGLDLVGKI